ncbi:hypothetical protein N7481_007192 [Penicillium waksmanii]|uniref:uncharacterized protein n=1 Tax=Penicillium waksmanii TaxID=69791 RepID=UPI002548AC1C|nr:uncharacterized protein N7481_007192 [Penicillium waksmanii]KAJ5979894.1 hypothetical protein N7481_007192 [Penicillium waksmanii]
MFSSETLVSPLAARLLLTGSADLPKVGTHVPVLSPEWPVLHASHFVPPPRGILKVPGASSGSSHARRVAFGEVTVDNYPKWIGQASSWEGSPWCRASWGPVGESEEDSDSEDDPLDLLTNFIPFGDDAESEPPVVAPRQEEEDITWNGVLLGLSGAYPQEEDPEIDDDWSPLVWACSLVASAVRVSARVLVGAGVVAVGLLRRLW